MQSHKSAAFAGAVHVIHTGAEYAAPQTLYKLTDGKAGSVTTRHYYTYQNNCA